MKTKVIFFVADVAATPAESEAVFKLIDSGAAVEVVSVSTLDFSREFDFAHIQSVGGVVPPHIKAKFDDSNKTEDTEIFVPAELFNDKRKGK